MTFAQLALRLVSIPAVVLSLLSCGGVLQSNSPAKRVFLLQPHPAESVPATDAEAPSLALSLSVVPGLDSDALLTLSPSAELGRFEAARWPDHLPEFVASLLRRSLQGSGRFSAVTGAFGQTERACDLALELRAFHTVIEADGTPDSVRMELDGNLECPDFAGPINARSGVSVPDRRLDSIVAAHQRAFERLVGELLGQLPVSGDKG